VSRCRRATEAAASAEPALKKRRAACLQMSLAMPSIVVPAPSKQQQEQQEQQEQEEAQQQQQQQRKEEGVLQQLGRWLRRRCGAKSNRHLAGADGGAAPSLLAEWLPSGLSRDDEVQRPQVAGLRWRGS
jgi:hypothetical protein